MLKFSAIVGLVVFSFSLCIAQDTLVYKTGEKIAIKVYSTDGNKIVYQKLQDDQKISVNASKIDYIKYADGSIFSPNRTSGVSTTRGMIDINAGIGLGLITWALPNSNTFNLSGDQFYNILTVSPAYNIIIDYSIVNTFELGLCGAYQSLTDNPELGGNPATFETERISRYNIYFRFFGHLSPNPVSYAYLGARFGVSIWTDNVIAFTPPGPGADPYTSMPHYSENGSLQLFLGYSTFSSSNLGFHFEVGFISPYVAEAGITFRFKTKK